MTNDKTKWSYLAALIDGEGCISIYRRLQKTRKYLNTDYWMMNHRLSVYNTNEKLMKWLIKNFGGVYYTKSRRSTVHKVEYDWRPKGAKNLEKVLLGVLPYLVIKDEQAKILLEYIRISMYGERTNPEKREELRLRLSSLNKRGDSVTTNTLDCSQNEQKIESELARKDESAPDVNRGTATICDDLTNTTHNLVAPI
jgi:hypothetical protein